MFESDDVIDPDAPYDYRRLINALPPLDRRLKRGSSMFPDVRGWPVRLLADPLAPYLAARGIACRPPTPGRARQWCVDGKPAEMPTVIAIVTDELACMIEFLGDTGAHCAALAYSRNDLAESARAASTFLRELAPLVPAPLDDLAAFLARYDDADTVERPQLHRDYLAAGSPGGLARNGLYRAAADRWAPPVMLDGGRYYFRPSRALAAREAASSLPTASPFDDVSGFARHHGIDPRALADFLAAHSP